MNFINLALQIIQTLEKEKARILQLQKIYEEEVATLPKGSIVTKTGAYGEYFALVYYCEERKSGRTKYLGKEEDKISALRVQIDRRKYLEKSLRAFAKDLDAIEKMLKPANKRIQQESVRGNLLELDKSATNVVQESPFEGEKPNIKGIHIP